MNTTPPIKEEIIEVEEEDIDHGNTSMICVSNREGSNFARFFDNDDSDDDNDDVGPSVLKKMKVEAALPVGFLDPLPPEERAAWNRSREVAVRNNELIVAVPEKVVVASSSRQFWKAGDYEGVQGGFAAGHAGNVLTIPC